MTSHALIIGIDGYPPASGLRPLHTALGAAREFARWLNTQGWVAPEHIHVLGTPADQARGEHPATRAAIAEALLELQHYGSEAEPEDRLYLFYAGYGLGHSDDQLLLLPQDTERNAYGESAIPWAELLIYLRNTGFTTQFCFLDLCHADVPRLAVRLLDARLPLEQPVSGNQPSRVSQYSISTTGYTISDTGHGAAGLFSRTLLAGLDGAAPVGIDYETVERVVRIEGLRSYLEYELPARSAGSQRCVFVESSSGNPVVARLGPAIPGELQLEIRPQEGADQATVAIYRDQPERLVERSATPPFHFCLFRDELYAIVVRAPGYLEEVHYLRVDASPYSIKLRRPGSGVLSGRELALAELLIHPGDPALPVRLYNSRGYPVPMPARKPRGYLVRTPPDQYKAVLATPERNIMHQIELKAGQEATLELPLPASGRISPIEHLLDALDQGQKLDLRLSARQSALLVLADGIASPISSTTLEQGRQQIVELSKVPGAILELLCHSSIAAPGPVCITGVTADGEQYQIILPLLPGRVTIVGLDGTSGWLPSIEVLLAPAPLLRRHSAVQRRVLWAQRFFKTGRYTDVPVIVEELNDDEPLALVLAGYAALQSYNPERIRGYALRLQAAAPTLDDGFILLALADQLLSGDMIEPRALTYLPLLRAGLHFLLTRRSQAGTPWHMLQLFERAVQNQIWLVIQGDSATAMLQSIQHAHISARMEPEPEMKNEAALYNADLLLVTVTDIETRAVLSAFERELQQPFARRFIGNNTYFYLGCLGGAHTFLVQSAMGAGGPSGAMLTITESILDLRPSAIIMVGIAFGVDEQKQNTGDILVARQLVNYEPQRLGAEIHLRGDRSSASPRMLDRFRSGTLDWQGAPARFGLIVSGEKLVDQLAFRDQLLRLEPEAIGGEMEGAGLYAAALRQRVDWILVKAICDWADGNKDQDKANRQQTAAHNAAQFVVHVIRQGGFAGATALQRATQHNDLEPSRATLFRQNLVTLFNESELRDLCFELGIDYDDLVGQTKSDKARELIALAWRNGRTTELVARCRRLRAHAEWPDLN